jgi:hypothetical protein
MDPEVAKELKSLKDRVQGIAHSQFEDAKDIVALQKGLKSLSDVVEGHAKFMDKLQERIAKLEK